MQTRWLGLLLPGAAVPTGGLVPVALFANTAAEPTLSAPPPPARHGEGAMDGGRRALRAPGAAEKEEKTAHNLKTTAETR